ncbi:hypothetical protein [Tabrizicola sp.]|uniref:hypothetical protein n=1 Tax=Tabrizicola sp. TaxID=2005166 RepID=UPI0027344FBF|nr:hypothetical protein [Tabrizicola sp.]MDP3195216.1 hypothetical protein [Tabrizicola sp.]
MKALIVAGLVSLAPTVALSEGCVLEGGTVVAKVEAMNQMMLNLDVAGFVGAIKDEIGLDLGDSLSGVTDIYAAGFDGCETIAQRSDLGGMVQNVVMFNGKVGPLFGYWLAVPQGDGHRVISFTLDTDLEKVMGNLR